MTDKSHDTSFAHLVFDPYIDGLLKGKKSLHYGANPEDWVYISMEMVELLKKMLKSMVDKIEQSLYETTLENEKLRDECAGLKAKIIQLEAELATKSLKDTITQHD